MKHGTESRTEDEFINYMPAMPNLVEQSAVGRFVRRLFRRRGTLRADRQE